MLLSRFRSVARGLPRLLEDGTFRGVVSSAMLTGLAAVVSFGFLGALTRSLPEAEFGTLVGWLNALLFLSVVAVFGQETMFVRSWNEFIHARRFDWAKGLLLFGAGVSITGWLIVSFGLAVAAWWLDLAPGMLLGLVLFLLAQTLCLFSSQTARMTAGIVAGVLHREITWRCVVMLALAWLIFFGPPGMPFSPSMFFMIAAAGILLAVVLQVRSTMSAVPPQVYSASARVDGHVWLRRSSRMWLAALLEAASQYLDVAIIALLLSPRDAAIYFVCQKLAGIFLMLGDAFGLYSSRQISHLYYRSELQQLQAMLRRLSLLMLPLCAMGLLIVAVGGGHLLQIFGATYGQYGAILMALSVGTAAAALGGPLTHLLLLTGHESTYIRVLAAGTLARYAGIACCGWFVGLAGAAVANAAAMVVVILVLITLCRRLVGMDPSVLALTASSAGASSLISEAGPANDRAGRPTSIVQGSLPARG